MRTQLTLQQEDRHRNYQGMRIFFDKIEVETLDLMPDEFCPFTRLGHKASFNQNTEERTLTGELHTIMRSQHENSKFGLLFNHGIAARGSWDYTEAQIVTIAYQFLFDWIGEYVEKENITDKEGVCKMNCVKE